jgi:calreticulin
LFETMIYATLATAFSFASLASAKIYFQEDFNDAGWESRWVKSSTWKSDAEMGAWKWTAGEWYGDASDKGIQTSEDARFYGLSAKMNEAFTNTDTDLVLQMSVKHEQKLDCGGAYIKLLGGDVDQAGFGGSTPYQVMFGPDVCGSSNRKTHVIFNYPPKDDNLLIKEQVKTETDQASHLYTLVVKPDHTFEVLIDMKSVRQGTLEDNWDFLEPKEIKDPAQSKPSDWVDAKKIADPTDVKPEGYDDIPAEIPDPDAEKPEDWDEEEDGQWEAPMIDNPLYKGPWKAKMIDNPDYKGEWIHPMIPNPDYVEDKDLHVRCKDCTHVGFELWQVTSGTIFDDIIVTDSLEEAKAYADKTFFKKIEGEKAMFEEIEAKKKEDAKKAAEENAAEEGAAGGDYDEEEHDEL